MDRAHILYHCYGRLYGRFVHAWMDIPAKEFSKELRSSRRHVYEL